jgi:2-phosphosulfolactate phosphatase
MTRIEVLFTPAEFAALSARDLSRTTCVVFDVLRATTTMLTALHHGAAAIVPVAEIGEALALRGRQPDILLAGERGGLRITALQSGGVEFDLGNSPREFIPERVRGRTIAMTTTNGTRALRACLGAARVWVGGLVNLDALVARLQQDTPECLLLICAGTGEESAFEDDLGAGALCDALLATSAPDGFSPSAQTARELYREHADDLLGSMQHATNGRRLLSLPELAPDVELCLRRNSVPVLAELRADGRVFRVD